MSKLHDMLIHICEEHILRPQGTAVVTEPYIPFLPKSWNRTLVLAEAQNLADSTSKYVTELKAMPSRERICRLGPASDVGVEPWDDGSLKIAVVAALDEAPERTAVSNAVLWSLASPDGTNINPSDDLQEKSVAIWKKMLVVLEPEHVLTAGKIACGIITRCREELHSNWRRSALRLPSPQALSRLSGMFDDTDLLSRYPEVARVLDNHPGWFEKFRKNKVFYGCHAVSILGRESQ